MKYVALLRGINVGGNSLVKMSELKQAFENEDYKNVSTYINSGNVIFESGEADPKKIAEKLDQSLSKTFGLNLRVVVRSQNQLRKNLQEVPSSWKQNKDIRCYIAFVKEPATVNEVIGEIALKEGIDTVKSGDGVIYMTTKLFGITKSGFSKLAGKKIYQEITIRNYNTAQKIFSILVAG